MAGTFQSVIERHWTGDYKELVDDNVDQALCLDSPGGSFLEAIEIGAVGKCSGSRQKNGPSAKLV